MPLKLSAKMGGTSEDISSGHPIVDVIPGIPSVASTIADAKAQEGKSDAEKGLDFGTDLAEIQKMAGPLLALMGIPVA